MTQGAAGVPAVVVGGYLGAGKTTLVNHLLRHAQGRRLAVLANDVGDIAIHAELIESREGNVLNLAGGCVCCCSTNTAHSASFRRSKSPITGPTW